MNPRKKISFPTYRRMLEAYERLVNVDYHACVGEQEKDYWKKRAVKSFKELNGVTCCKERLVYRFEVTVDKAVKHIENIRGQ